jgi:hypothetical protein
VPQKESISKLLGTVKGKIAIQIFRPFPNLKSNPYWGNHFLARDYCLDTVVIDEEIIRKYVKFQEREESRQEITMSLYYLTKGIGHLGCCRYEQRQDLIFRLPQIINQAKQLLSRQEDYRLESLSNGYSRCGLNRSTME